MNLTLRVSTNCKTSLYDMEQWQGFTCPIHDDVTLVTSSFDECNDTCDACDTLDADWFLTENLRLEGTWLL